MTSNLCRFLRFIPLALMLPLAAAAQVNLTVNAGQTIRTVDERVFGVNAVIWDAQASSAQTISMVQNAGIRTIRVPGGSLSDEYHWRINKSLANTWTWSTAFNGFINLITSTNAQPVVTVNYGSGTPEEAAGLVAYLNASVGSSTAIGGTDGTGFAMQDSGYWAALRAAGPLSTDDGMNFLRISRSSPVGAKYFEIGNECYGTWETDQQTAAHDPTTYANRVQQYIAKMKAVDPSIKIGVVVVTSSENASFNNWTPVMLARLKTLNAIPDFIIYHLYPQAPGAESDATLLQVADAGSKSWSTIAADLRQQLTTNLGSSAAAGVEIVVTENNSVYSSPGKQSTSLVNGLYLADSLGNLMKTEINGYMYWALRNGPPTINNGAALDGNMSASLYGWRQFGDYGMISTPSTLTGETTYYNPYPTYYMMKLLSHFARGGDTVVQATSSNPLLSIFAAKRADGSLSLLVINKDASNPQNATIALSGYTPGSSATVYSYGKPEDSAGSSHDITTTSMPISGTTFSASFASYSATVVSFSANVAPTITTQPVDQTVDVGGPVTLTVVAGGSPSPSYQWYKDGSAISGAMASSYSIVHVALGDAGTYQIVVSNSAGSVTSKGTVLTVRDLPVITTQPLSSAVFAGGSVNFIGGATGTTNPTYQWQRNGIDIAGATSATLALTNIQISDAGSYALVATNAGGSATSRFARL
ncbi:MAG TPA: immunoglobulin domain-containing protein, partial [Lacunisphaera sp.]